MNMDVSEEEKDFIEAIRGAMPEGGTIGSMGLAIMYIDDANGTDNAVPTTEDAFLFVSHRVTEKGQQLARRKLVDSLTGLLKHCKGVEH